MIRPWPESPLNLPEAERGAWAIKHSTLPTGETVQVVSPRQSIMTGRPPVAAILAEPLRIHSLTENGTSSGVWMTDNPAELVAMHEFAQEASGRVLVGGLGLGIVVRYLAQNPRVRDITVVEREQDVIDLIRPQLLADVRVPVAVVHGSIFRFLGRLPSWPYDSTFLDTWTGTGVTTWQTDVVPLRRLIGQRFGARRVTCWSEREMQGQVRLSLNVLATVYRERGILPGSVATPVERTFLKVAGNLKPTGTTWRALADLYTRHVGTASWERRFGAAWDESQRPAENP